AMQGKPLPVPAERLPVFMMNNPDQFKISQQLLDVDDANSDGFVALRDNLLVVTRSRQDAQYQDLIAWLQPKLQDSKIPEATLLKGEQNAVLQNAVLMRKALEVEGETAAISEQGPRQLLAASGLLPRKVRVPDWVQSGMGGFFGTPKGSPYSGIGL